MSDSDEKEKSNLCLIPLDRDKYAIVDPELFKDLKKYTWRAQKSAHVWYAVRRELRGGKVFRIKMHRQIAQTPPGMVCHHKNGRGLDNRSENLENMYPLQHKTHHIVRKHQRKLNGSPTIQQKPTTTHPQTMR